ncbi:MAG: hypothetical protein KHY88_00290 [Erysipelotrichaceae bacterium]|nr:hypothetical protein [Erysipelotrichaceae bacterium]
MIDQLIQEAIFLNSKETKTMNERVKLKKINQMVYELYGKIRYIVEVNHCRSIKSNEVIDKINEKNYKTIEQYYFIPKETIDNLLKYVNEYSKL